MRVTMGLVPHPKVLAVLALAAVLALSSSTDRIDTDANADAEPLVIAYLGGWPEAEDAVFARFVDEMRSRHGALMKRARLRHLQAVAGDEAGIARAVADAVSQGARVIVTPTGRSARVAVRTAGAVPVVFSTSSDPVRTGIRESPQFSHAANTGVSLADWLDEKRLEILRDAFPEVRRVAVLADRSWVTLYDADSRLAAIGTRLGLRLSVVQAESADEVTAILGAERAREVDAWYIPPTYVAYVAEAEVIRGLRALGKPAMHATVREVERGALMAYEQDGSFVMGALADLVARVVAGEFAGAIPVQTPQRYRLAVRTNGAGGGLGMSPDVIRRADQVF